MKSITLITHNENKVREFKSFLEPLIDVKVKRMEYPELRSDEAEEIVALAAKQLSDALKTTVVVEDSGFHINALSGFPGTVTAYAWKRIGNKGLLRLMEKHRDRRVHYKSAIGLCEPGKKPAIFSGIERGRMARKERGTNGWGQDPIFVPEGSNRTYGETRKVGDVNKFRRAALEKLKKYLQVGTSQK